MNSPGLSSSTDEFESHPHDSAAHASYVFLLDAAGGVHPLPHRLYVALAREGGASTAFAGKRLRLADWYVRMSEGTPERVVNEWYGWVSFDDLGRFDPAPDLSQRPPAQTGAQAMDPSALPTVEERRQMEALLFSGEWPLQEGGFGPGTDAQK